MQASQHRQQADGNGRCLQHCCAHLILKIAPQRNMKVGPDSPDQLDSNMGWETTQTINRCYCSVDLNLIR